MYTIQRLYEFMLDEARSCSMDFYCITPFMYIECGEGLWLLMKYQMH